MTDAESGHLVIESSGHLLSKRGNARLVGLVLAVLVSAACDHDTEPDCRPLPCPLPIAITVTVTSSSGGPVSGVTVAVSGTATGSGFCRVETAATICSIPGGPGVYNLRLTAPGFQEHTVSVTVPDNTQPCGCTVGKHQDLAVTLTPS